MLVRKHRIPFLTILTIGFLPSKIKKIIYRLKGYKIGKKVKIGFGSILLGKKIKIGDCTKVGFFSVFICKSCSIGEHTQIGSLVYFNVDKINIGSHVVIRENNRFGGMDMGQSALKIGDMSHIHQGCYINTTLPVDIGNNTAIGGSSCLFTHSSWQSILEGYPCTFKSIKIGNNVWLSWNVFILPGVQIGDGTLVAAGSVVTKSLPDACLAQGNPAKTIVPAGMFPRKPHPHERYNILSEIISAFNLYMRNNGFAVSANRNQEYELFTYTLKGSKHTYELFLSGNTKESFKNIDDYEVVIISLERIDMATIKNSKCVFIDIENKSYIRQNKLSSELIRFLKHFGLRLTSNYNQLTKDSAAN